MHIIILGRPDDFHLDMDSLDGNTVSKTSAIVHRHPHLVQGRVSNALNLNGNGQFINIGIHRSSCLGNVDRCSHGLLLSLWLKPSGQFSNRAQILSTGQNGVKIWQKNNKIHASVNTATRIWKCSYAPGLEPDRWSFLEVSWHPDLGVKMYINGSVLAESGSQGHPRSDDERIYDPNQDGFYVGRGNPLATDERYSAMAVDDLTYWYSDRDYLIAFDYIERGNIMRLPHSI